MAKKRESAAPAAPVPPLVGRLTDAQALLERLVRVEQAEELAALKADVLAWLEG